MKKLITLALVCVMLCGLCACTHSATSVPAAEAARDDPAIEDTEYEEERTGDTDESASEIESSPQVVATYSYSPTMLFSEGLAWVTYKDEVGTEKYCLIDEHGAIIYIAKDDAVPYSFRNDGYTYYSSSTGDVIVDMDGKEHLVTSKSEENSVSICGHGDNVFILRKKIKTFSQNAIYISMIDADGNIIYDEQEIPSDLDTDFEYFEDGIFRSYNGNIGIDGGFVNANTGAIFKEYRYDDEFITPFEDGKAYFKASGFNGMFGLSTLVTPDIFESEATYFTWHQSLTTNDEARINKPDLSYSDGIEIIEYGSFDEGFAPVILLGTDNREYFTVVNDVGNQQYEPLKLPKRDSIIEYNLYENGSKRNDVWRYTCDLFFSEGCLIYLDDEVVYLISTSGDRQPIDIDFSDLDRFEGDYIYLRSGLYNIKTKQLIDKILLYSDTLSKIPNAIDSSAETNKTAEPSVVKSYSNLSNFTIEGKWQNIGSGTFGQVQENAIVYFDGTNCNFFSPKDTYAIVRDGDNYKLTCTSFMSTDTLTFTVKTVDKNNIDIYYGSTVVELTRVD